MYLCVAVWLFECVCVVCASIHVCVRGWVHACVLCVYVYFTGVCVQTT